MLASDQLPTFPEYPAYQNDLKKHLLVNLHEFLVPLVDVGGLAAGVIVVTGAGRVVLVVRAPFDHLSQDGLVDLWQRKEHGQS